MKHETMNVFDFPAGIRLIIPSGGHVSEALLDGEFKDIKDKLKQLGESCENRLKEETLKIEVIPSYMTIQPLLTRLDELEKSITKGEWAQWENDASWIISYPRKDSFDVVQLGIDAASAKEEDIEFICELHNAYPTLRAEIERLQEVERKYEEMKSKNHT